MKAVLLGAHTELGRAIVEMAETRDISIKWALTAPADHLEPDLCLLEPSMLREAEVFVVATHDPETAKVATALVQAGKAVIDGVGCTDLQLAPNVSNTARSERPFAVRPPRGAQAALRVLLSGILAWARAAGRSEAAQVHVQWFESASRADRPGIEELSTTTQAVFTLSDPEPSVFFAPAAFNVLADSASFSPEPVAEVVQASGARVGQVARFGIPSFHADLLGIQVCFKAEPDRVEPQGPEVLRSLLEEMPLVRRVEVPWSLDRVVGREDLHVLHCALTEGGDVHLWVAFDRIRFGGALPVVQWLSGWAG